MTSENPRFLKVRTLPACSTREGYLDGLVTGAVIGGVAHAISPPTDSLGKTFTDAYKTPQQAPPPAQAPGGGSQPPWGPPPPTTSGLEAGQQVGMGLAGKGAAAVGGWGFRAFLTSELTRQAAQVLIVDSAAGAWDLGYVPWILHKIGEVKVSGTW